MKIRQRGEKETLFDNGRVKVWVCNQQGPSVGTLQEPGYFYDHYFLGSSNGGWSLPLESKEQAEKVILDFSSWLLSDSPTMNADQALTAAMLREMIAPIPDEGLVLVDIPSLSIMPNTGQRFATISAAVPINEYPTDPEKKIPYQNAVILSGAIKFWRVIEPMGTSLGFIVQSYGEAADAARGCGGYVLPYFGSNPLAPPLVLAEAGSESEGEGELVVVGKDFALQQGYPIVSEDSRVVERFSQETYGTPENG